MSRLYFLAKTMLFGTRGPRTPFFFGSFPTRLPVNQNIKQGGETDKIPHNIERKCQYKAHDLSHGRCLLLRPLKAGPRKGAP